MVEHVWKFIQPFVNFIVNIFTIRRVKSVEKSCPFAEKIATDLPPLSGERPKLSTSAVRVEKPGGSWLFWGIDFSSFCFRWGFAVEEDIWKTEHCFSSYKTYIFLRVKNVYIFRKDSIQMICLGLLRRSGLRCCHLLLGRRFLRHLFGPSLLLCFLFH